MLLILNLIAHDILKVISHYKIHSENKRSDMLKINVRLNSGTV